MRIMQVEYEDEFCMELRANCSDASAPKCAVLFMDDLTPPRPVVYIAHPIGGAVATNIKKVQDIVAHLLITQDKVWPIAPYLDACMHLDDNNPQHRETAMLVNELYFKRKLVNQLWVYGDWERSIGVQREIALANACAIDVLYQPYPF